MGERFRHFKDRDFSVEGKPRLGQPKKFQDKRKWSLQSH